VRVRLVGISEEKVEPLARRGTRTVLSPKPPFASEPRRVARRTEHFSHGDRLRRQIELHISAKQNLPAMLSGHQNVA